MWTKITHFLIKQRLLTLIILGVVALIMGYLASKVKMTHDFFQVVPASDPEFIYYKNFKQTFGEDANLMTLGFDDSHFSSPDHFLPFKQLIDSLENLAGVKEIISLPSMLVLEPDRINRTFKLKRHFDQLKPDASNLDSLMAQALVQKFYIGRIYLPESHSHLVAISLHEKTLNSKARIDLVNNIVALSETFAKRTQIKIHYAGLPYIRTVMATKVKAELNFFLILSLSVTALILLIIFRSLVNVVVPLLLIGFMVVFTMGTLTLFGFEVTLLTGLLPPIIVVIGIPNSVYMLNKYHFEFKKHGNKIRAISSITRKIGFVTLLTNLTTAIGFASLILTNIEILRQFGIVASLSVMFAFFITVIAIPGILAYLPEPNKRQLKHLDGHNVNFFVFLIDRLVSLWPKGVLWGTLAITAIMIYGGSKLKALSFMADDLSADSNISADLGFFEQRFNGIMPIDFVIDAQKPRKALSPKVLAKIDEVQEFINSFPELARPISVVDFIKTARQAFYNQDSAMYALPSFDKTIVYGYLRELVTYDSSSANNGRTLAKAFVDTSGQYVRISGRVKDIGSIKTAKLLNNHLIPGIDSILNGSDITAKVTGTTYLYLKGNGYLISNLKSSLILAVVLIAIIMFSLFGNFRMVVISLIPNIIPLIITAGLMGFLNIPLKPSTILIFSIAFGISVDDAIHFLARYRQETRVVGSRVADAVSICLRETGSSMFYTSIILFAGFIIFTLSKFGGTFYLGLLTSITLLLAMTTNLILLPILVLLFDKHASPDDFEPIIEHYEIFYLESEDEEIDISKIEISKQ